MKTTTPILHLFFGTLGILFLFHPSIHAQDDGEKLKTQPADKEEPAEIIEQPEEHVVAPGEDLPDPEIAKASGDIGPEQDVRDGCGVAVLGIDPDMAAGERPGDVPVRANFMVKFQDVVSPLTLISTTVMPGEELEFEALFPPEGAKFSAESEGGKIENVEESSWKWKAPKEKGYYCVKITEENSGETICVNTFVMVPYEGQSVLNGYKIGSYESEPLRGDKAYERPAGFIEVTEKNKDTWLTPHFQLRQFIGKQKSDYPKYVLISPKLLLKLEMLLQKVQEKGIETSSFFLVSGHRTPWYNSSIGNQSRYSRHTYGDAADVMIDTNGDGKIDDLNGDGKIDDEDVRFLFNIVEEMTTEPWYKPFQGGLGFYEMKDWRSGFIHVDTRGSKVRW